MLAVKAMRLLPAVTAALFLVMAVDVRAAEPVGAAEAGAEWQVAYLEVRSLVGELQAEVDAMKRLRTAQKEVMEWNVERARLGLPTMTLRPELCLEAENERWCRLFPATFGVQGGGS